MTDMMYVFLGSVVDAKSSRSAVSSKDDSQQQDDLTKALADLEKVLV